MTLPPLEVAFRHQTARARTATTTTVKALRLWRQVDPQELDAGWDQIYPEMVSTVTAGQVRAASQATSYLAAVDRYHGLTSTVQLVPEAFGGVSLDGREIGPAMFGAVTTTKELTGRVGAIRAFEVGATFLASLVGSMVQDMGRQGDNALAAGRGYTRYIRFVNPGACSRCAILAGKSSYKVAFKRHLRCKCTAWPIAEGDRSPSGFFDTPEEHFDSLSRAEQDRVYGKSGAESIRMGADPISVVNARRGAYGIGYSGHYNIPVPTGTHNTLQKLTIGRRADGSPLSVFATTEGTTARGAYGRRSQYVRLLPEQIMGMSGDPVRIRELLRRYGYLQ